MHNVKTTLTEKCLLMNKLKSQKDNIFVKLFLVF